MSLLALINPHGPSGFGYSSTAEDVTGNIDLTDRTFLLTGCNSGIGFETLRVLCLRGAHVIACARSVERAEEACAGFEQTTAVACDLSEPVSVRACVETVRRLGRPLQGILCNAGIMALPKLEQKYGYELQFLTNHIGHFILVTGLVDALALDGRVVMTSSAAHLSAPREGIEFDNLSGEKRYSAWAQYGQSKLANLLFARELAVRFAGSRRTANAVHPGVIKTRLARHMNAFARVGIAIAAPLAMKTVPQGAATQLYVATHHAVASVSGEYFADCNIARSGAKGQDSGLARQLWAISEEIAAAL